jgi:hypothetical protein
MSTGDYGGVILVTAAQLNIWQPLYDDMFGARVCRLLVQNQGVGNLRLCRTLPGQTTAVPIRGILLAAPAPPAGQLQSVVVFIDEATGGDCDNNHRGGWYWLADAALTFEWDAWVDR